MTNESVSECQAVAFLGGVVRDQRPWIRYTRYCSPPTILQIVDAQDVLMESIVKALTQVDSFRGDRKDQLGSWLRAIIRNTTASLIRSECSRPIVLAHELRWVADMHNEPPATSVEIDELVTSAMGLLSAKQQLLFVEVCIRGTSVSEIALDLGLSKDAAYAMLYRAKRRVRAFLVENGVSPLGRSRQGESVTPRGFRHGH